MEATTKDLRLHTRELLAATHRGEEVTITFRGKPTARLVPLEEKSDEVQSPGDPDERYAAIPGFGMWADDPQPVDEQVRNMRKRRKFD